MELENQPDEEEKIEFIRIQEVVALFGVSRAVIDRWCREKDRFYRPDFPKKVYLGKFVFFVKSEIQTYMKRLVTDPQFRVKQEDNYGKERKKAEL